MSSPKKASPRPSSILSHMLSHRRWWYFCLSFILITWVLTTSLTPRRFRFRVFKSSRPTGGPRPPPVRVVEGDLWSERANEVRRAFLYAYKAYQHYGLPHDEVRPMTAEGVDDFHGWGVTMFDSLDTMWLMGLEDLFYDTVEDIDGTDFYMDVDEHAHFFEVVIRYLGGLLSAYALSEDPRLLKLADDLGRKLLPAFDTPSGIPLYGVNTKTGGIRNGGRKDNSVCLAEALSNQVEFKYLAHITGKSKYYMATERPMKLMYGTENIMYDGLLATMWNVNTGKSNQTAFTAGGCADSAYEYFLKQWLLTGKREVNMRDLYVRSANAIIEHLLYVTTDRELLYVTDLQDGEPSHHFNHLSCFLPGLLALGAHSPLKLSKAEHEKHTWAAEGLANMCWTIYGDTKTGLSPDSFNMQSVADSERERWAPKVAAWAAAGRVGLPPGVFDAQREWRPERRAYAPVSDQYLLRPEAVETFYLMWRTTGDEKWRERGWAVFKALQTYSRVKYGYTSIRYLDERTPFKFDDMPSWFFAETLKYLFLLFTDEELIPLDKWVFNTEAHPLPVFEWSQREIEQYNISH
ncbi:glycoside hydrolase family 47 protein [Roridomyces roridus]|uniref:alpha-1,2-Mannosidase n=1 Tax=Roridomyces roridus TaxID=1738132 RepID=A0AAD7FQC6_9AGAR|nr:glycoside hydrolase family 47 protein [Roridomyces roridus]